MEVEKAKLGESIDIVYLWCDGNEKAFRERKKQFLELESGKQENIESVGDLRFFDCEELKYSLRSLEMYAPWINHVYIVTDRQIPKWLNTDYEKVTVVDHSEIMPKEIIPCFNSSVIEYFIPYITGLSEKFLFANDDMFFGRKVSPEDFFVGNKPIARLKIVSNRHLLRDVNSAKGYSNSSIMLNAHKILNKYYGKKDSYVLHHNIDAYNKSFYLEAVKKYYAEIKDTFKNRFRKSNDVQRLLINLDAVYSGNAELRLIKISRLEKIISYFKPINVESYAGIDDNNKYQSEILRFNPMLFCINSGADVSGEHKMQVQKFMQKLFPFPSKFEL